MQNSVQKANNRVLNKSIITAVVMFGFGFLWVPIYDIFCDVTGLNGKTGRANEEQVEASNAVDEQRWVTVEFMANVSGGLAWDFKPMQRSMRVHPGQVNEASYLAINRSGKDIVGQAVPSVAPGVAAKHFQKTECFCFTQQLLKGGEEKQMPLRFVVDPALPSKVNTVTLAYTFFESKEQQMQTLETLGSL